ncbi:hypothetical protein PAXRUDRAFT_129525 [Paxillus rubicundulus Ve08.2h10]|uniref:Uncharacterized protein n=1 Tax=Paxillus rubicundulus Ve08.2h10 TaxID=930991 RepID=A0A0D0E6H8_9AGAM|nr:hypothetical protein PAXRUDRAFT_129525 [Paxillus rubicundulus Ve08.2h10]
MDLPTPREIELETALRKRDAEVAGLTNDISRLRQFLAIQPQPSTTDSITLPSPLVSVLLPHINQVASSRGSSTSSTVNAALTQRVRLLQEENDELYELLKYGETGKLKEEVRGLRRVVDRLESALRDSHQAITSLSTELDKSYQNLQSSLRQKQINSQLHHPPSRDYPPPSTSNGLSKPPPTGPRAHKKPRLSDVRISPAQSNVSLPPSKTQVLAKHDPSRSPRILPPEVRPKSSVKMEVDEDSRTRPRSPRERDRERQHKERVRDRERDRDRDRERERDRNRVSRRNGTGGGSSGGRRSRGFNHPYPSGDRTLAERMGL